MSTNINITVGGNSLVDQAKAQQQAARQAQLEKENRTRLEREAAEQRTTALAAQGRDATGALISGSWQRSAPLRDEPAAQKIGGLEVGWLFTEQGFLAGGQAAAFRQYCTNTYLKLSPQESFPLIDTIQNPAWTTVSTQKPLNYSNTRINWEQSSNCGGTNGNTQIGNLKLILKTTSRAYMGIRIEGKGERQDSEYERLIVKYNDESIGEAFSPGGSQGCAEAGPVVYSNLYSNDVHSWQLSDNFAFLILRIDKGLTSLVFDATTLDSEFHVNAYYSYEFQISKSSSFAWT